ncbi:hypothetical protein RJ639_011929 [Escallonia herrerae]|uniref:Small auxin up regulated protein n=1 Tax=Escallonia herrerae TaxID=1293975 RepID=A0AA89AQA4_9ASTE|nr:hypothetical protein RJ639_011929 [Escallonia herrerae]
MINSKKLIKMARKWKRVAAIRRKRISLSGSSASVTDKGHFVVYSTDRKRYLFPLVYLDNYIFKELLKVSEEEYGLPTDGPIVFPCDTVFMDYAITLIQKCTTEDVEKALLMSIANRCSSYSLHQQETNQRLLIVVIIGAIDVAGISFVALEFNCKHLVCDLCPMTGKPIGPNMSSTTLQVEEIYGPESHAAL